jgi:bifunctional non-homologous end joining protein LigD
MPLDVPPPRTSRFGTPLVLSRVHWARPELVVEVNYLTRTPDNLLRQVAYVGLREDQPAHDVQRPWRLISAAPFRLYYDCRPAVPPNRLKNPPQRIFMDGYQIM